MCFSATASFTAATLIAGVGIMAIRRATLLRELPLASIPLGLAAQQGIEGRLWLALTDHVPSQWLTTIYIVIALVVWPPFLPLAVGLVEPQPKRRQLLFSLIPAGLAVAAYSMVIVIAHPYTASIVNARICYISPEPFPDFALATYAVCICVPPLLSSHASLRSFGFSVMCGAFVSAAAYYFNFISVWCFFAALASVIILAFFERRRLYAGMALRSF